MPPTLNRFECIGQFTRDPVFSSIKGVQMVEFGLTTDGQRVKDHGTNEWVVKPFRIEAKAYNRGNGFQLASLIKDWCQKGDTVYVHGKLIWEEIVTNQQGPTTAKRVCLLVEDIQIMANHPVPLKTLAVDDRAVEESYPDEPGRKS